jgi:inosine/xanthosine triphosphatase
MKIIVASRNPAKIKAVEDAFARQFPDHELDIESLDIASGVGDQPIGDAETRRGARNRANRAGELRPDAEFCVGLEGGIETIDDQLMAYAWMVVRDVDGTIGEARTVTLPLPERVKRLVDDGMELGAANDRVFSTTNSKQKGGAFGLLTGGMYTREGVYSQALTLALVPFVNDLYH